MGSSVRTTVPTAASRSTARMIRWRASRAKSATHQAGDAVSSVRPAPSGDPSQQLQPSIRQLMLGRWHQHPGQSDQSPDHDAPAAVQGYGGEDEAKGQGGAGDKGRLTRCLIGRIPVRRPRRGSHLSATGATRTLIDAGSGIDRPAPPARWNSHL